VASPFFYKIHYKKYNLTVHRCTVATVDCNYMFRLLQCAHHQTVMLNSFLFTLWVLPYVK